MVIILALGVGFLLHWHDATRVRKVVPAKDTTAAITSMHFARVWWRLAVGLADPAAV